MAEPLEFNKTLSRFKRLPLIDDVWQAAVVTLPTWVEGGAGGDPHRPSVALAVSTTRPAAHVAEVKAQAPNGQAAAAALLVAVAELGNDTRAAGYRPRVVQVRDPLVVPDLAAAFEGTGTVAELVERLPALDTLVREMAAGALDGDDNPPALDAPGVTPERLRSFADAAKQFYDAAPWRYLDDGDLVKVEAPKAGKGLSLVGVMGSAGQEFGLSFFESDRQYRRVLSDATPETMFAGGAWGVWFNRGWEIPASDLLAWDEHQLPLASPRAYPIAGRLRPDGTTTRANASELAYLEGLLRAIGASTEAEMDSGRWTRTVQTFDGAVDYTLTLPDLLDPPVERQPPRRDVRSMERATAEMSRILQQMSFDDLDDVNATLKTKFSGVKIDDLPSTASSPLERAQDLIYEAMETRGRRQLQLIRRALEMSPDCADAYVLLAERSTTAEERQANYEQAVAAGERALGPEAFTGPDRSFWGDVTTRPYMRARFGLADTLAERGDATAAIEHFQALLQLNPNDNQGARYRLLSVLLGANRLDEAEALLGAHDDASALWSYGSVLAALKNGERRLARTRLRAALRTNRHVPKYLTGQRELPAFLPETYSFGSHEEAVLCAADLVKAWDSTPGAIAWLTAEVRKRK
jgi:tetratricopeptide (TPR) repeat protein